jgi:hypothetical protein
MKKKAHKSLKNLTDEALSKGLKLDDLLREWFETKSSNDPGVTPDGAYYQGARSFKAFLQTKLPR